MVDTRVKTTEGECLSPSTKAAQRRKHGQAQSGTPLPCCCPLLHAQGGHTNCPQRPAPPSPSPAISFCLPGSQQHHLSWGTSLQAWLLHLQCHRSSLPTTALDLLSPTILHPWGSKDLTLCWPLFVHHHPNDWMTMAVCSMRTLKVSDCTAHQESCWRVDCSTREAARSVQNTSEESTFGQEEKRGASAKAERRQKQCECW